MRPMTTWHRLGDKPALLLQVPTVFKLDRWSVAVFHHDGRFRAIGNACNHKGGPLSEGRLHGEFVMCPWHAWEYSVITGKGPAGYDEEQVPVFAVEEREDGDLLLVIACGALPRDDAVFPGVPGAHHELAVEAALRQRAAFVVTGVADRAEPTVMVKNGDRPAVELQDGGDLKEELGLVAEAVPRGHGTHPLGAV